MKGSCITKSHIFQINFHQIISAYRKRYTTNYVQIGLIEHWKAMLYKNLFAGAVWKDHETIIWIYLSKALNFTPHNLLKVNRFRTKCYNERIYSALWNEVKWFKQNWMIANSHKFKAVTLNKQSAAKYKYRNDRESRMKK